MTTRQKGLIFVLACVALVVLVIAVKGGVRHG